MTVTDTINLCDIHLFMLRYLLITKQLFTGTTRSPQLLFENSLKFFELYLGVPAILHPSRVNFSVEQRKEQSLYHFVHLLYCAEIFRAAQAHKIKVGGPL